MNTKIKLKKNDIKLFIISLIFFLGLFRMYFLSLQQFKIISSIIMIIYLIVYGRNLKVISLTKQVAFFSAIVVISIIRLDNDIIPIFNAIWYSLQIFNIFSVTCCLVKKNGFENVIKCYMFASMFITILMDISVLFNIEFDELRYQNLSTYLFGNKFLVSYLHLQTFGLLALYWNKKNKSLDILYTLYTIFCVGICLKVDCSTGIVGIIVVYIMLLIKDYNIKKILMRPGNIFIILIISNIIFLQKDLLVENPIVQYIVVDLLNENLTFTGRFYIYELLFDVIKEKWILGYGYNTDIITNLIGYGNAQNGILQIILECGVIGGIVFLIIWNKCISNKKVEKNVQESLWPLYAVMYAFMSCSLVEVCFKINFFIVLAVMLSTYFIEENIEKV